MYSTKVPFIDKYGLSIVLVIVSLLIYSVLLVMPVKAKPFGDGDFHEETKVLAAFVRGEISYENLAITKAPGPVLYYLVPYTLASADATDVTRWKLALGWTAIITTLSLVMLVNTIRYRFGFRAACIFSILIFVVPLHVYYSMGVLAEGLAFLGVCWIMIGFLSGRVAVFYVSFTLGIVALVLARPNAGLVIPLLAIVAVFLYWRTRDEVAKKVFIAVVSAAVLIALVMTGVKSLPNKRATLKQEEYLSFVMHHGRFQFRTETFDWRFWDDKTRADSKDYQAWQVSTHHLNQIVKNDSLPYATVYYNWVFHDMLSHPVVLVKQFFVRLLFGHTLQVSSRPAAEFAMLGLKGNNVYWIVHIGLNLINYTVVFFALYFLIVSRQHLYQFWPLIGVVLALWMFHGVVYMEQRYLFPVRPVLLLFAASGILHRFKIN